MRRWGYAGPSTHAASTSASVIEPNTVPTCGHMESQPHWPVLHSRLPVPGFPREIAAQHEIDLRLLRGPDRRRAVSAARRVLARATVVERGIRPVDVSRYLGVSRAAITAQLRAHDT